MNWSALAQSRRLTLRHARHPSTKERVFRKATRRCAKARRAALLRGLRARGAPGGGARK
jgi:hypothetical protein